MKKTYSFLGALLTLLVVITASQAADGNVQINGEISTSSCEVDVEMTDANYGTINYGSIASTNITHNNIQASIQKFNIPFSIFFKNCQVGAKASMGFRGMKNCSTWIAWDGSLGCTGSTQGWEMAIYNSTAITDWANRKNFTNRNTLVELDNANKYDFVAGVTSYGPRPYGVVTFTTSYDVLFN